jgi:hypothetical protein
VIRRDAFPFLSTRAGVLHRHLAQRRSPQPIALPLAIFAGLALAMAYVAYVLWPRWPGAEMHSSAPALPITIDSVTFNIPPAAIRTPVQRRPGTHERIDLAFAWPALTPPDASLKPTPPTAEEAISGPQTQRVFLTIASGASSSRSAERALTIYTRYTNSEAAPGPGGLIVLAFRDGTPYQGEDLFYDAQTPGFLVRCTRPAKVIPGTCLHERWLETVKLVIRFPREWLADWRKVAGNIDRLIASLRPHVILGRQTDAPPTGPRQ